jgi:hypothetical protein
MKHIKSFELFEAKRPIKEPTKKGTSIYDFMQELRTWIEFDRSDLELAKRSACVSSDNPEFAKLIKDFQDGVYDDDLEALEQKTLNILKYN